MYKYIHICHGVLVQQPVANESVRAMPVIPTSSMQSLGYNIACCALSSVLSHLLFSRRNEDDCVAIRKDRLETALHEFGYGLPAVHF